MSAPEQKIPQETAIAKVSKVFLEKKVVDAFMNTLSTTKGVNQYVQSVLNTLVAKPELLECTPKSIVLAALNAAALGLSIDQRQEAYLVAYNNKKKKGGVEYWEKECQMQIGYRGYGRLGVESGSMIDWNARCVYTNEKFKVYEGSNARIEHEPIIDDEVDRGKFLCVYAIAKLTGGSEKFIVLGKKKIEKLRLKNRMQKEIPSGAWASDYDEMAMAKALKQLAKTIPMGRASFAAEVEDAIEEGRQPAINVPFTVLDEPGPIAQPQEASAAPIEEKLGPGAVLGDEDFMPDFDQPVKYEPPPASKKEEDPRRLKLIVQFGKVVTTKDVDSLFVGNQLEKMFGTSELDKMPVDTLEMAIAWAKGLPSKV